MKKIIVPSDFSENSLNAFRYACQIAQQYDGKVTLLHAYKLLQRAGSFIALEHKLRKEAETDLEEIIEKLTALERGDIDLDLEVVKGKPIPVISAMANKLKADLIVMGTQGASGMKEVFFGSNTNGVIKQTNTPVLAIPANYEYHAPQNIVLSVDSESIAFDILVPLLQIVKGFDSKVMVLHVHPPGQPAIADPALHLYLTDVPHEFHTIEGNDINNSVNAFVREKNADLLCMIKKDRGYVGNLLHTSVTQANVFQSTIPVLILH